MKVLRFFDEDGELLPTPQEAQTQRAEQERQRANTATQRAEVEAAARQVAEAELARLRALLAKPGE